MNSCTSCLEAALNYFNVKNSDVLVPCATFVATASAVALEGGNPIICDVDQHSLCLTLEIVKANITPRTKGIIYVHFSGYVSEELSKISKYCRENGLFLIEDCAHATGGRSGDTSVGMVGDVGCFSFYSTKIVTAAEAGIAITSDTKLHTHLRSLQYRGLNLEASFETYDKTWRNVRLSEFNAIIGIVGLKNINSKIQRRRLNATAFSKSFDKLDALCTPMINADPGSVFWKYIVVLKSKIIRDNFLNYMTKNNVLCDTMYTPLLHQHEVFSMKISASSFPVANDIFGRVFACLAMKNLGTQK